MCSYLSLWNDSVHDVLPVLYCYKRLFIQVIVLKLFKGAKTKWFMAWAMWIQLMKTADRMYK